MQIDAFVPHISLTASSAEVQFKTEESSTRDDEKYHLEAVLQGVYESIPRMEMVIVRLQQGLLQPTLYACRLKRLQRLSRQQFGC